MTPTRTHTTTNIDVGTIDDPLIADQDGGRYSVRICGGPGPCQAWVWLTGTPYDFAAFAARLGGIAVELVAPAIPGAVEHDAAGVADSLGGEIAAPDEPPTSSAAEVQHAPEPADDSGSGAWGQS